MVSRYHVRVTLHHGNVPIDEGDEEVENEKDHGQQVHQKEQYAW